MNPEVDNYFDKLDKWGMELKKLRTILLDCGLTEDLKWGSPCYSYEGSNVSIIGGLNDYCVLSFFKGVLLHDEHNLLEKPGDNTRSARVIPITSVKQITSLAPVLKAYIYEAIEIERAGLKVVFEAGNELEYPEELTAKLAKNPKLKAAFAALTPGRKRGYILHFAAAKQPKTREARIDKFTPKILEGKGMNDY